MIVSLLIGGKHVKKYFNILSPELMMCFDVCVTQSSCWNKSNYANELQRIRDTVKNIFSEVQLGKVSKKGKRYKKNHFQTLFFFSCFISKTCSVIRSFSALKSFFHVDFLLAINHLSSDNFAEIFIFFFEIFPWIRE